MFLSTCSAKYVTFFLNSLSTSISFFPNMFRYILILLLIDLASYIYPILGDFPSWCICSRHTPSSFLFFRLPIRFSMNMSICLPLDESTHTHTHALTHTCTNTRKYTTHILTHILATDTYIPRHIYLCILKRLYLYIHTLSGDECMCSARRWFSSIRNSTRSEN